MKKFTPVTPSQRFRMSTDFKEVTTDKPQKSLLKPLKKTGGRNNQGRITVRHRGGGHKRMYRLIDFKRQRHNIPAKVKTIEYDPNRSSYIALIEYKDNKTSYIIAPENLEVGKTVISGPQSPIEIGNALPLSDIPSGTEVHNIEMKPGTGGIIARSAGNRAQVMGKREQYSVLKLPSSETRLVLSNCYATIGNVSNATNNSTVLGKAGRNRWLGRRPRTRGVAMNPVDHPMGGGEGKASGGHPRSKKGLAAKGKRTRKPNRKSNRLILTRRK